MKIQRIRSFVRVIFYKIRVILVESEKYSERQKLSFQCIIFSLSSKRERSLRALSTKISRISSKYKLFLRTRIARQEIVSPQNGNESSKLIRDFS